MNTPRAVDLAQARKDPGAVFQSPEALASDPRLSREEKIDLLKSWELDVRRLSESEAEGMPQAPERSPSLGRIVRARQRLEAN